MNAQAIVHMFSFTYKKPASEIIAKMKAKIIAVSAKIEERQKRVADLRTEYEIDDAALVQLLTAARKQAGKMKFSYSTSNAKTDDGNMEERTIGAGVVNNLLTENDFIEAEKDNVKKMNLIVRNLQPIPEYADGNGALLPEQGFHLSQEELEYLEF